MSSLNSSYTGSSRLDDAVLFTKDNSARAVHSRPYLSAYHESLCGQGIASFLSSPRHTAHSSPTPQWDLFRLFSTPASLAFATPAARLRPRLLSDCSNIVSSGTPPPVQSLPKCLFFSLFLHLPHRNPLRKIVT